jgi:hypothetical protein
MEISMKSSFLFLLVLLGASPGVTNPLFTKGTWTAGGSLTLPLEWRPALQTTLSIHAEPDAGIFFADGWLVAAGLKLRTPILESRLQLGDRFRWGVNLSIHRYWNVDWKVKPFIALSIDYVMKGVDFSTIEGSLNVPVGIFVPVSDSVGLEFGIKTKVTFVGLPKVLESVRIDPGYFGLRVFI